MSINFTFYVSAKSNWTKQWQSNPSWSIKSSFKSLLSRCWAQYKHWPHPRVSYQLFVLSREYSEEINEQFCVTIWRETKGCIGLVTIWSPALHYCPPVPENAKYQSASEIKWMSVMTCEGHSHFLGNFETRPGDHVTLTTTCLMPRHYLEYDDNTRVRIAPASW